MFFIGVDSGGTKTAFVLADETGKVLARYRSGSGGFFTKGKEGIRILVQEGVQAICEKVGISVNDITFAGLGFPGYGEKPGSEKDILEACEDVIGKGKVVCDCDCYLGWAGSLAMQPGINIVAGTGSICYGVNESGKAARSSGWGAYCDEGSCSWIGGKLIAAFAKESDGRAPCTVLYDMFREHFGITNDTEFIHTLNHEIAGNSDETAKLQYLLKKMYDAGSETAKEIYQEAAKELSISICATAEKLGFDSGYIVSYSGGLFRSGDCILEPLRRETAKHGGVLKPPCFEPEMGALLFAMRGHNPDMDFAEFQFEEIDDVVN